MRKVCVVVTARPSYSRVKTVLMALRANPDVELQVVAAASALVTRFGRVVDVIREDGFEVTAEVPSVVEGGETGRREAAVSTGLLTSQLAMLFSNLRPDVVVTIADRHETLATAIAASYQHIPLCHIQGGEISGSIDDKVRNAITQLANLHLVSTRLARDRVFRVLALRPDGDVRVTGCPSIDLAAEAIRLGPIREHAVIALQHGVLGEAEEAATQIRETILAIQGWDVHWFWPGDDAGGDAIAKELRLAGIHPTRNVRPVEFLRRLLGADLLVGNSSVGIRECSYLGVPAVNIGTRQRGRERGPNVVDVPHDRRIIRDAVRHALSAPRPPRSALYGDGDAGNRIAHILAQDSTPLAPGVSASDLETVG